MGANPFDHIEEQFLEVRHSLNLILEKLQPAEISKPSKQVGLLSRKELAERLGISLSTVVRYGDRGIITQLKVGSRVLFNYDQVISDLQKSKSNRHGSATK